MVLIGLFALVFLLTGASPAHAIPVAVMAAILPATLSAFAVSAITFAVNFVLSAVLSFAVGALLRPTPQGGRAPTAPTLEGAPAGTKITAKASDQAHPLVFGRTRVGGVAYPICATNQNQFMHYVVVFAGHPCLAYRELWINDEKFSVSDIIAAGGFIPFDSGSKYAGMVRCKFYLGDANQEADPDMLAEIPEWTAQHRGRGLTYIYFRLQFGLRGSEQPALFSDGAPNFTVVLDGWKEAYDPRTGLTGWTDNVALLTASYLCNQRYGFRLDYNTSIKGPSPEFAGEDALIAAANQCDELVDKIGGGKEKRYTANGALMSSQPKQDILGRLLGAMAGRRAYDGETWFLYAGAWQPPTDWFTNDDLRGQGMVIDTVSAIGELFNCGKGKYYAEANNWQLSDFPAVKIASYVTADGQENWVDTELPLTNSPSMAQRIVKILIEQSRMQTKVKAPCKLSAWRTMAGNTIGWDSMPRHGWSNKVFEVLSSTFELEQQGEGGPALCVTLKLVETAPGVYSWSSTEETILREAPRTLLPDVINVVPPANLVVTEELYVGRDGAGVKTRAIVSWEESPDYFVHRYRPQWRDAGGEWNILADTAGLSVSIDDMTPGQKGFGVSAVNYVGNASPVISVVKELNGLLDPPQAVQNLSLTAIGGGAYLRFDKTVDLDVDKGGWIVFKHSPATSGATWDTASPIGDRLAGNETHAWLPLKAGTYLARFLDSSERYSTSVASVVCKQASVLAFTPATGGTLQEDSTFTGSKTNCSVSGGKLGLTAGQAIGTYLWHATMDLGAEKSVRLTVSQAVEVENVTDFWDSTEICDSDEPWDTAVSGNEAYAVTYVRETDDDPTGSPTWGPWTRLDSGEFSAWGFQFKTVFTAVDLSYVAKISALAAVAEEVV